MNLIVPVLSWWLAVSVIGWFAVPMAVRLFPSLPDRGVAFARPLGMLVVGYTFWLVATIGLLPNSRAGSVVAVSLLAAVAAVLASQHWQDLRSTILKRRTLYLGYELLFLAAFVGWAAYRAFVPNIESAGGEKYMEMAFINAVVESPSLPPLDPWLSGFAISYYYFGYVIAGMLIHLTGVAPSVAFNLLVPMTLAMTMVAAFGLGYNLAVLTGWSSRLSRAFTGAFAAVLLPLAGSLVGAIELGYLRGWGPLSFYRHLNIRDLTPDGVCGSVSAPFGAGADAAVEGASLLSGWIPSRFIWWWRGSRVIHDDCREVIHEFPFFSFMLGDVHPHVVALPYVLLAMAFALMVLAGGLRHFRGRRLWSPSWLVLPLAIGALGFLNAWDLPTFGVLVIGSFALRSVVGPPRLKAGERPDAGVIGLGAIGLVVVAWSFAPKVLLLLRDVPEQAQPLSARVLLSMAIVAGALAVAYAVWARMSAGDRMALRLADIAEFAVWVVALAVVFYLPFYVGFRSQAGGIGVVDIRSRLPQWFVHFGLMWFLAISLAVALWPAKRRRLRWPALASMVVIAAVVVAPTVTSLWSAVQTGEPLLDTRLLTAALLAASLMTIVAVVDQLWRPKQDPAADADDDCASDSEDPASAPSTTDEASTGASSGAPIEVPDGAESPAPLAGGDVAGGHDVEDDGHGIAADERRLPDLPVGTTFAVMCVGVGLLLPFAVEFVFIRDLFGSRMNSVFKLFYQAWALLAIGGAVAPLVVWRRWPRKLTYLWAVPAALLFAASLIYPVSAVITRTNGFNTQNMTLDGLAWWELSHADDLASANWLRENTEQGSVILEAYGGAYEHNGRLSMASGRPTVLGWEGHEHQWRGSREEIDPRKPEIESVYKSLDRDEVQAILDKYRISYLVASDAERSKFGLSAADLERIDSWYPLVYESPTGQVKIYEAR